MKTLKCPWLWFSNEVCSINIFTSYIYVLCFICHRCLAFLFVFFFVPERCTVLLSLLAVSLVGVADLSTLALPLSAGPVVELLLPLGVWWWTDVMLFFPDSFPVLLSSLPLFPVWDSVSLFLSRGKYFH